MTKIHSALVLAVATTVALSSTRSEALSLLPWQQRQQRRARVSPTDVHPPSPSASTGIRNHGLFGKKRSRRSSGSSTALQWMLPHQVTSLSSPFLSRLLSTKEKEDVSAAYDDADDEKSWPIKPVVPHPPPLPPSLVDQFSPLLDPTIAKNVPADTIQGAALNGAVLTLLASVWLFGPLSAVDLGTLVAAASIGILAAYVSITEGFAGDLVRGVGSVTKDVADAILTGVEGWQAEQEVGKVANFLLETPLPKKAEFRPRPPPPAAAADVAVDYDAAARLAYDAAGADGEFGAFRAAYRAETSGRVAQKRRDALAAEAATARAAEEERAEAAAAAAAEKAAAEATAAAERKAAAEEKDAAEAIAAAEKQAAAEATVAAERKAAAEEKAAAEAIAAAEKQAAAEATVAAERKAAAEEKAVAEATAAAEEKAAAAAAEKKRSEEEEAAAARARAEEEAAARAKAVAEEEARAQAAEEQAQLEARARALEEARLVEAEERRVAEEQAAVAREAVRLMEEQKAQEEEDEQEEPGTIDDEDWDAAVRLADELQEGAAVGGDVMGALNDDMLRAEINDLSAEEEDALGKAAREAVRKYEEELARAGTSGRQETRAAPAPAAAGERNDGVEEAAPAPPLVVDYSKMTVVQLKSELRSKGLKMSGKKTELIERLETS